MSDLGPVVLVRNELPEDVVVKTGEVASTENVIREATLSGVDPVDAYEQFGVFQRLSRFLRLAAPG